MLFTAVMFLGSTLLFNSCAANHPPMPEPIYGRDIITLNALQPAPFKGTLFSDFYLNEYLQWKNNERGN